MREQNSLPSKQKVNKYYLELGKEKEIASSIIWEYGDKNENK